MHDVTRGYFGLRDNDHIVHVTSDKDFVLYIWARNVKTFHGGIQITTPPSQFRGVGSTGPTMDSSSTFPRRPGWILAAFSRVRRDHRHYQRVQRPGDDLSHGAYVRSEQCDRAARVGPLLQL